VHLEKPWFYRGGKEHRYPHPSCRNSSLYARIHSFTAKVKYNQNQHEEAGASGLSHQQGDYEGQNLSVREHFGRGRNPNVARRHVVSHE